MDAAFSRFIRVTKGKCIVMCLATLLPAIIVTVFEPLVSSHFEVTTTMVMMRYIIFVLFEIYLIYKIVGYFRVLSNKKYAEERFVRSTDERLIFIRQKSYSFTYKFVLYSLCVGLVVTGFINAIAFYTLLIATAYLVIVSLSVRIYYYKKY